MSALVELNWACLANLCGIENALICYQDVLQHLSSALPTFVSFEASLTLNGLKDRYEIESCTNLQIKKENFVKYLKRDIEFSLCGSRMPCHSMSFSQLCWFCQRNVMHLENTSSKIKVSLHLIFWFSIVYQSTYLYDPVEISANHFDDVLIFRRYRLQLSLP